jgi:hypothetical protein
MIYDPEKCTVAYPYVEVLSVLPDRITRADLVNMDRNRLEEFAKYFNQMAESDVSYEVREDVGAWERHLQETQ